MPMPLARNMSASSINSAMASQPQSMLAFSTEFELHLACCRGDPPTQLEEGEQALPPAVLIALAKILIPHPHPDIGQSHLEERHDLVLGVIEFIHLPRLRFEIFLLPKDLPQFPAVALAFV